MCPVRCVFVHECDVTRELPCASLSTQTHTWLCGRREMKAHKHLIITHISEPTSSAWHYDAGNANCEIERHVESER